MAHQTESQTEGSGAVGPALAILATAPRPGLALPGACPPLAAAEAAGLATAWLKVTAQEQPGVAVYLCGRPADALPMLHYFAGPGVELRTWCGDHAGPITRAVLAAAAAELFALGHGPVLVRTADTPDADRAAVLACLEAARAGACVLGRDQRGAPWLLAAGDPTALDHPKPQPGPWARCVQDALDVALLWRERADDDGEPAMLPVRDLQSALRWYEVVLGAELLAHDGNTAVVAGPDLRLRLVARGPACVPNGVLLPCRDPAAVAAALRPHRAVHAGDELAERIGGGTAVTATDDSGNRLTFTDR